MHADDDDENKNGAKKEQLFLLLKNKNVTIVMCLALNFHGNLERK